MGVGRFWELGLYWELGNSDHSDVRIAIDARKLRDYGIGTYVRNLLRHLARLDQTTEYVVLCHEADKQMASHLGENFRPCSIRRRATRSASN